MAKNLTTSDGKHITRFGQETEFTGELQFTDTLIIGGKFSGRISATGNLEIAEKSVCSVDSITADTIVVSGMVSGNITAPIRVEMKNGSKITGNVVTKRLRIENGVDFCGQVTMLDSEEKTPDIFSVSSAEYRQMLVTDFFVRDTTPGTGGDAEKTGGEPDKAEPDA